LANMIRMVLISIKLKIHSCPLKDNQEISNGCHFAKKNILKMNLKSQQNRAVIQAF
jgi:hypothetical protein